MAEAKVAAAAAAVLVAEAEAARNSSLPLGQRQAAPPPPLSLLQAALSCWPEGTKVPETLRHEHGSARCVPLDSRRSRGLREPDSIARAEAKRLYVRRTPYLVTGCLGRSPLPLPQVRVCGGGLMVKCGVSVGGNFRGHALPVSELCHELWSCLDSLFPYLEVLNLRPYFVSPPP